MEADDPPEVTKTFGSSPRVLDTASRPIQGEGRLQTPSKYSVPPSPGRGVPPTAADEIKCAPCRGIFCTARTR